MGTSQMGTQTSESQAGTATRRTGSWLKVIVAVVVVLVAIPLAIAAFQDPHYKISRDLVISETPEVLFSLLVDPEKAYQWMPWSLSDPHLVMRYEGPKEGVGAKAVWDSPGPMGQGESEVIAVDPLKSVKTQLRYFKPFKMEQVAEMSLVPEGASGTRVIWSVEGKNNFIGRLVCLFVNMDKQVGQEFSKGLVRLASVVETAKSQNP